MSIKKRIVEATTTVMTAGPYTAPIELGLNKWKKDLQPFTIESEHHHNHHAKNKTLKKNVKRIVGVWEKKNNTHKRDRFHVDGEKHKNVKQNGKPFTDKIHEDLAVWFGTKKKPKGSKQPKGPWVNICRKKEGGGHPPCGRPEAKSSGYPKCRAAGVAARMTDTQKKSACAQKRRAEKTNPKSGTGNKPKMVSYKPKKESKRDIIKNILREYVSRKVV